MSSFPSMYRSSRPTCYLFLLPEAASPCRDVYLELLHFAVDDLVGVVRVNERRLYIGVAEHLRDHLDGHPVSTTCRAVSPVPSRRACAWAGIGM